MTRLVLMYLYIYIYIKFGHINVVIKDHFFAQDAKSTIPFTYNKKSKSIVKNCQKACEVQFVYRKEQ